MRRNAGSQSERILVSLVEYFGSGAGFHHISEAEVALHRIKQILPFCKERLAVSWDSQKSTVGINVRRPPIHVAQISRVLLL